VAAVAPLRPWLHDGCCVVYVGDGSPYTSSNGGKAALS
jgi:hypothetical protein